MDNFFEYHADLKEREKELKVVVAVETAVIPVTHTEVEDPRATGNEVEVADENLTSCEAPKAEVVDETVRAITEARDEDLPITYAADAGNMKDDDEDEDGDSPNLPDAGKDLGDDDDEDDDDDDFTIQY
ncbi:DNA topoisomerase 1-like [Cynara cardunculus var. scolymus]|uniref:DNA topoisomerase 1-like n=1 Tax=Cynara cardunculus var. scolymus TaxID=59895 RepID=UPI000D62936E|nr:DNA topoisomerase 1-like [Cynara cardunculus var. scolymus]